MVHKMLIDPAVLSYAYATLCILYVRALIRTRSLIFMATHVSELSRDETSLESKQRTPLVTRVIYY